MMATTPTTATPAGTMRPAVGGAQTQNQQELNQIVIEYLVKKGYTRTEAQLRMESTGDAADGRPLAKKGLEGTRLYVAGFQRLKSWAEGALDIYKPELRRLLWPVFVYIYLQLVRQYYVDGSKQFFESFSGDFKNEHQDELRQFQPLCSPETLNDSALAKKFASHKYRLTLSKMGYSLLVRHLEETLNQGGSIVMHIIQQNLNVVQVERAADDKHSIRQMLARAGEHEDFPQEDEGIPGHNPGSANLKQEANSVVLQRLKLGPLPMEPELLQDVQAELADEDERRPPADGQPTLLETFNSMIKVEDAEDGTSAVRSDLPLPASKSRDVAFEVQKVKENRARFKIEHRTGGVAPAISVCMFTFHNTMDGINCIGISDDNQLIAAGMAEHYIRVWRIDGKPLPSSVANSVPSASRRLVGHYAPVFGISFSPAIETDAGSSGAGRKGPSTESQYLLSASADKTVRLWDLSTWSCLVVYEGHMGSVWDVRWGPFGHYFATASRDGTARLWSTEHKSELRVFVGHDQDINYAAFHPNNLYLFTGGYDKTVRMWSVTTGHAVRLFTGHAGDITALVCAPNGKLLASADDAGVIIVWDLAPGKLLKRLRGHDKGGITSLSFNVESNTLISGGIDGTVRVWDIQGSSDSSQQGKVVGEGGAGQKIDASAQTGGAGPKKKGKEAVVSAEQIGVFPTKKSPVYDVKFTRMNLAVAAGAYLP